MTPFALFMGCKTIFCPGDVGTHCAGRAGAEALFTGIRSSRGPKRFSNPGVAPEGFFADTAEVVTVFTVNGDAMFNPT